ncbi:unnamed protein product [Nezara viridula]|uniref:Uncharacterized protein n=1 Tax=Nezara viridula TaxID=85310 RepID=A0A9P0E601_NEZVI|nr:unnamed protein product [Nezara viridula]
MTRISFLLRPSSQFVLEREGLLINCFACLHPVHSLHSLTVSVKSNQGLLSADAFCIFLLQVPGLQDEIPLLFLQGLFRCL